MTIPIRLVSDLHLEFGSLDLPVMDNEDQQILVLAGDVGLAAKSFTYAPYLEEWAERFREIIYICGNHEHYGTSLLRSLDKIKTEVQRLGLENVNVLEQEVVHFDDVSFVCATLWASFNQGDPLCMYDSQLWMNDHKKIRIGPSVIDAYKRSAMPQDLYLIHVKTRNWIFPAIKQEREVGQKVCVVTHHMPSFQSVHESFRSGQHTSLNGAYASELDYNIVETDPTLWIHGHTHFSFDYMIENTRVINNPRGYYPDDLNSEFNPTLVVEL